MERADHKMNWIPVTERLPEVAVSKNVEKGLLADNGQVFLVTYEDGEVSVETFWAKEKRFDNDIGDVIAWMSLPEPYQKNNGDKVNRLI